MIAAHTNPTPSMSELTVELERLRQFGQRIAQRLVDSANIMKESGLPPVVELLEELQAYRNRLQRLAKMLAPLDSVDNEGTIINPSARSNECELSFTDLQTIIASRQRSHVAEEVRDLLVQLRHVNVPNFAPLADCVRDAERLCELAKRPPEADEAGELELLNQHRSPLNALLRLAEEHNELSDLEWTECYDNVAAKYGRQLATALSRGHIRQAGSDSAIQDPVSTIQGQSPRDQAVRTEESSKSMAAVPAADSTIAATSSNPHPETILVPLAATRSENALTLPLPTMKAAQKRDDQTSFNAIEQTRHHNPPVAQSDSIFESPSQNKSIFAVPATGSSLAKRGRSVIPETPNAGSPLTRKEPAVPPARTFKSSSVHGRVEQDLNMARAIAEDPGTRATRLPDGIIRLLKDDRLPIALQLTRCLEMRPEPSAWSPPSWLLRALILGRHLSYSKGEIAWQLDNELRNFRTTILNEGNADRQMAMGLLLRAAALPAALLAGSTTATGILRAFKITPDFSQLYNYCNRVGLFADRLEGSLVDMFRLSGTIAGASELENLAATAREWLQNAASRALAYSRTSPLFLHAHWTLTAGTAIRHAETTQQWCKWQQTLLIAQRLLKPVCQGLDGDRNWVRQEITRLTSQIRVESQGQVKRNGASSASGRNGTSLPAEEMHAILLEAITIANRWLRLCDQAGPGGASPIPPEALELRSEILQRSDAVINELIQNARKTASPLVKAAIACCQVAVRQIQSLFESKRSLPAVEPDPRHVLNADLLRLPGLELNEDWLPINDPTVIEREILASLNLGELSWRQIFDLHAHSGNHDATGRLLELNVWENRDELEALRATRETQIKDNRTQLATELNETATAINLMSETDDYSLSDRASCIQRLDGLRSELPFVLNFNTYRHRLSQLRSSFQRRRSPKSSPIESGMISADLATDSRNVATTGRGTTSELTATNDSSLNKTSIGRSANIFSGE